ncbi:hypothetical protein [Lactobacillus sp. CBA3605]|uniref:hypothetical protein n=1 Tax=Lactobacillus sp. CBA3605 TaxID=2099788 RepID=UPI001319E350|nr:hypothetical protein [Lactobacillus sp. CBA3605]
MATKFQALDPTRLNWDGRIGRQFWLAIWALYFGDATTGQTTLKKLMAVERLHRPIIDTNLRTIIQVRQLEAQAYRKGKLN